jgi:uncharacterized protein YbaR (Trm112 family)
MKKVLAWLLPLAIIAIVAVIVLRKLMGQEQTVDLGGARAPGDWTSQEIDESQLGGEVSPDLLRILVCPLDKGPLSLSADGKWLINPRNGYRYPIRDGIPVMLIDEGRKHRDESLTVAGGTGQ